MVLGSMPAYRDARVSLSGIIFSSSKLEVDVVSRECQGFRIKNSHGADRRFVSICSLEHHSVLMMTWSPSWEKKGETLREVVIRTKHKHNVLTQNDIIFEENLKRESADADNYFRSILTLALACIQLFYAPWYAECLQKHHLRWSFFGSLYKRNLESVQEEDFLLPCVQKCVAPG